MSLRRLELFEDIRQRLRVESKLGDIDVLVAWLLTHYGRWSTELAAGGAAQDDRAGPCDVLAAHRIRETRLLVVIRPLLCDETCSCREDGIRTLDYFAAHGTAKELAGVELGELERGACRTPFKPDSLPRLKREL